ncbi:MAG: BspA family leucine-rich repeat surface protein [Muribaculaceae bacterium]|nr:BspA family leucine-rich repeat surface protein [Muribaculaceae bacterium]
MKKILLILLTMLMPAMSAWASTFTVDNDGNTFIITRNGSGNETVYYRTVNLSAFAGVNYTERTGELVFTGDETQKTIEVNETPSVIDSYWDDSFNLLMYAIQTGLERTYRFELLDGHGLLLAYKNRDIPFPDRWQFIDTSLNKNVVTDLVYFDDDGNLKSGDGNKYIDRAPSYNDPGGGWVKVTDAGYGQGIYGFDTRIANYISYVPNYFAETLGMKVYTTLYFSQKEENDGYQYIQIIPTDYNHYDGIDPDGAVNDPDISIYKACFELSKSGVTTSEHFQFFPHRYDYVNKEAEQDAGLTHYSFDYDNSYLYQQKYNSNAERPSTTGSLVFLPYYHHYFYVRFDAAGNYDDNWYFKNIRARMALVDPNPPYKIDNCKVSGGRHSKSNSIYVSVPFNELVKAGSNTYLNSTWGKLNYFAGNGTNVLTFQGAISSSATGTFTVSSYSGTITDLAGNNFTGTISQEFGINLQAATYAISYDLAGGSMPSGQSNPTSYTDMSAPITLKNPVRGGYNFKGWTGSNGPTPQTTVTIPSGTIGDLSYTANWELVNYNITYNLDGGTLPAGQSNPTSYNIGTPTFTLNNPTKPGYDFMGWTGSNGSTPQITVSISQGSWGNLSYTANWRISRYVFNSATGELALIWGEFNKDNKWGDDVPADAVTSVTATNQVSFTGDCSDLFTGFSNCTSMDLNSVNTSAATNMNYLFTGCAYLTSLDLSNWDTGNVTNMKGMFLQCNRLDSLDLSNFNTANVTNMSLMFDHCMKLKKLNVSGWDTGNVTGMYNLFYCCYCLKTLDLSGWSAGKVTEMNAMFAFSDSLTTIYANRDWNIPNSTIASAMFSGCTSLVGGMGTTFNQSHSDKEYARIDGGPTNPGYFTGVFTLTLPADVTASATPVFTIDGTAYYTAGTTVTLTYNGNVPEGKIVVFAVNGTAIEGNTFEMPLDNVTITATITDPPQYTYDSTTGELALIWGEFNKDNKWGDDVPAEAVTSVTATSEVSFTGDCSELFYNFESCESMDLSNVNTSAMTSTCDMFCQCEALTSLNISNWDIGNVTNMAGMFNYCSSMTSFDISGWNTAIVTDMEGLFANCSSLTSVDLSDWDFSSVTNLSYMFPHCQSLTSLDLSSWNIYNATNMSSMFYDCTGLTSLDLSGWDTGNVTSMMDMFNGCSNLTTIYVSTDWSTEKVTMSESMFDDCTSLVGGMGTTYDQYHTNKAYARIDGGSANPGYFTANIPRYTYDSTTGALSLNWGVFNKDDKWGSEVIANNVTSVTATNKVNFTGDCSELFKGFTNCTSMELNNVNTSAATSMTSMFENCSSLTSLDITAWNTGSVSIMNSMFKSCTSLNSLDVSNFNTMQVYTMMSMFHSCSSLKTLDISGWDTRNLTNPDAMFQGCSKLKTIYAGGGWTTQWVYGSCDMFTGCTSLVGGMGTTYNASHTGKEYARIDGGPTNPGYFTDPNALVVGDVTGEGDVDVSDVNAVINIILHKKTQDDYPGNADITGEGNIDVSDVNAIINIILK